MEVNTAVLCKGGVKLQQDTQSFFCSLDELNIRTQTIFTKCISANLICKISAERGSNILFSTKSFI